MLVASPSRALHGEGRVPGDKSISHRAIILGALAEGRSMVRGLSAGEDNQRTVEALRKMGVEIRLIRATDVEIEGVGIGGLAPAGEIDCGNSGTAMRLLAGICATLPTVTRLDGDASLRKRPMQRISEPLERMGAEVRGTRQGQELFPPLEVEGRKLSGIAVDLSVASAQVKSAVLLAGLSAQGPTQVREPAQSRDHTERLLKRQGAPLVIDGSRVLLDPSGWDRRLRPLDLTVPGDLSSAAFLLVAALVVPGSDVTLPGVLLNPTRTGVLDVLRAMGATLEISDVHEEGGEPVGTVRARSCCLRGCDLGGDLVLRAIDEIPILALAASQAHGVTVIRDAEELRRKESDRIASMARVLSRLGCEVHEHAGGLAIHGPCALAGGSFAPDDILLDHRVAMTLAVAGLCARAPVEIMGAETIASSFPTFVKTLAALGAAAEVV